MDKQLKQEIALIGSNPFWPSANGILRAHDDTLLEQGGGNGIWIYDKLEKDDAVFSDLQKRKLAVIGRPWSITPASDTPADQNVAEQIEQQLQKLPFNKICLGLLDAVLKGFAVGEIVWNVDNNQIIPRKILMRDQRRFHFNERSELLLITWNNLYPGEPVPDRKFIVHRHGAKDDNPYGIGLGSALFWPVYFKQHGTQFWAAYLERFGQPGLIGKTPEGTPESERKLFLAILQDFAQETHMVIPEDYAVDLLEAGKSGGGTVSFEGFCQYNDNRITRIILGDGDLNSGRGGGALAAAAIIRNEVRLELVQADADLLADTLNESLLTWMTEFNFPGTTPPRIKWDVTLPEDLKAKAERDLIICNMGFEPDPEYINRTYDGAWRKKPAVPPTIKPDSGARGDSASAEELPALYTEGDPANRASVGQSAIDAIHPPDDLLQKAMDVLLQPVMDKLQNGSTPDEIVDWLPTVYPQMNRDELSAILARALFVSRLWGAVSAQSS
ncbi:MAG: DUF935 family protein [Magnetococcales bacterium]|nr:DUF935 family protein [Magnetococcales bacterium]